MVKLNLHLHTRYSDGSNSIEEMAVCARDAGHCCLVTSDHDYHMDMYRYREQLAEAEAVSKRMNFPIICGLEISLWYEEAVLIGSWACRSWLQPVGDRKSEQRIETAVNHAAVIAEAVGTHEHALCLVHPSLRGPDSLYRAFHAYEVMNAGTAWPVDMVERMARLMPGARPVRGMDAHSTYWFEEVPARARVAECNEIETPVTTEAEVIAWMRSQST